MNHARLDQLAEDGAKRYELFTEALQGVFGRHMNSVDFGKADQINSVLRDCYDMADVWMRHEEIFLKAALEEIAGDAHQTTFARIVSADASQDENAAQEHLADTQSYLHHELIAQIQRDIALVRSTYQRLVLQVKIAARAQRIPLRRAFLENRIAKPETPLAFVFLDRKSRKWKSRVFVRTVWRHTLLSAYNEVVMSILAEHGHVNAVVASQVDGSEIHNATISLTGALNLMSYDEVRAEYFHPNSQAYLIPEGANV